MSDRLTEINPAAAARVRARTIVTPSTDAAKDTRLWVEALRKNVDQSGVRVRDVFAIDLPFFMSEDDAIGRAKEKSRRATMTRLGS